MEPAPACRASNGKVRIGPIDVSLFGDEELRRGMAAACTQRRRDGGGGGGGGDGGGGCLLFHG